MTNRNSSMKIRNSGVSMFATVSLAGFQLMPKVET
jgi:hypothetical protein